MTTLGIIGDSLTDRAEDHPSPPTREMLTRAVMVGVGYRDSDVGWKARGGKSLTGVDSAGKTTMQDIADLRSQLGGVGRWVIALGTNNGADDNPTFAGRVNTVLDAIYPTGDEPDRVYWVNMAALNPANATYARLNPVLASTLAGRPEGNRITLLDWHTHIHSPGIFDVDDWLPADIPHMTAQGYAKRDAFIAEAVRPGISGDTASLHVVDGDGDERATTLALWVDDVEHPAYVTTAAPDIDVEEPDDDYPEYPTMLAGYQLQAQQIDTSYNQGWTQTNGVRTTDQAINRAANTAFGQGPDNDAMVVTVTYDGTNYYSSDAQARFCPMPPVGVVEWYGRMGPLGSGSFPAVWARPSGAGDGEMDFFEWKGKFWLQDPNHISRFVMNYITTYNGSYTNQKIKVINLGSGLNANSIDLTEWHHYRFRWTSTSGTFWMDGIQLGQITRANSVNQIGNTDFDSQFGGTHDWYLRVTYQFGLGTKGTAGGPADPNICPTQLWVRDIKIWEPEP